MRLDDPEVVRREYESETRFLARRVAFVDYVVGRNAEELALEALVEAEPRGVLEVGCGTGAFAERVARQPGARVVALDISPRMVELARARGVDARVGDVQELCFGDDTFDAVVANWILHHVPDLDRGLSEIARVLRPGGRLAAATFGGEHLLDLYRWLGDPGVGTLSFSRETGFEVLRPFFHRVERRDADGTVVFPDRAALGRYLESLIRGSELAERLPEFAGPFRARSRQALFIAEKAA